jgi:dTDP-4-amino-4,6-dideoxygalactose transaminase
MPVTVLDLARQLESLESAVRGRLEDVIQRLDALQSAVLQAKLPRLAGWDRRRAEIAAWYGRRLRRLRERGHLTLPIVRETNRSLYNQNTIRTSRRDELRAWLNEREIACAVYYSVPLHLQLCFAYLGLERGLTERGRQRDG